MSQPLTPELQCIKDYLQRQYSPISDPVAADFCMSTGHMYSRLSEIFPADGFSPTLLFTWLTELGYSYRDLGEMKVEWLLKRANVL